MIKKRAYDRDLYEAGALAEIFTHFLAEEDQKGTFNGKPKALLPVTSLQSVCTHGHTYKTLPINKSNKIAFGLCMCSAIFLILAFFFGYQGVFNGPYDSYLGMHVVDDGMVTGAIICVLFSFGTFIPAIVIWVKLAKSGLDWHVQLNTNDGQQFLFPFATEEDAEVSRRELDALIN